MVRTSKKQLRYAFTLIELIFAIVVIAISVMSLPMMARVNAEGMKNNLIQEAIYGGAGNLHIKAADVFDRNSEVADGSKSNIIALNNCATDRPGLITRECNENTVVDSSAGFEVFYLTIGESEWLDLAGGGYRGEALSMITSASGAKKLYKYKLRINTPTIEFGDATNSGDGNIKEITIILKDEDDDEVVTLRTYAFNVGDPKIAKEVLH